MSAVVTQIRAALRRRRAQAVIVAFISLMAAAVSTLSLTLVIRDNQPFDDAFAAINGPHLVFHLDANRISKDQLDATTSLPGVSVAGPPRAAAVVPFEKGSANGPIQVIERDSPQGNIDRINLLSGRWPSGPGEIAVALGDSGLTALVPRLGDTIQAVPSGRTTTFKVVGLVGDLTGFNNQGQVLRGWVVSGELSKIIEGSPIALGYEMPYRFRNAATDADLAADRKIVENALPAGAEVQAPTSWLDMRSGFNWLVAAVGGIIFAFSALALIAVVLVVASVVAGMVVASYREFGIAKALGFTPSEVVAIVTGQMVAPAVAGAVVGVPFGVLLSSFFLDKTSATFKIPSPSPADPVIDLSVLAGVGVVVALAALIPALRAARTNSIQAISLGSSPRVGHRSRLASILLKLGAAPPISFGAGDALARPIRATLTVLALGIGIATLTFAFTFGPALQRFVDDGASYGAAQDVNVVRYGAVSDQEVMALIDGDPSTRAVVATRQLPAVVAGKPGAEPFTAMRGDAPGFGYHPAAGRWFSSEGEAVVASLTARDLHLHPNDSVTVSVSNHDLRLRVVGIANDQPNAGRGFKVNWQTLTSILPTETPDLYMVELRNSNDVNAYTKRLTTENPHVGVQSIPNKTYAQPFVAMINGITGGLTLVLALVAAAGVFNATLLSTRERLHDIATLKSLGMTPAQIAAMAASSSLVVAVVAALVGLPAGMWLLGVITGAMGDLYGFVFDTSGSLNPITAVLVIVGSFAVALAGAAIPARWAAATPVAQVLRSE